MSYLEEHVVGQKTTFGAYQVTRAEVIDFASRYDPQSFHLDDDAAAKTHFGKVSASGWHTCAMTMRMMVDAAVLGGADGLGSPGIEKIRWLRPVYPGDTLHAELVVTDVRPSRSRPDMGSVHSDVTVFNQNDEPVMTMSSAVLVRRRPAS